MSSLRRPEGSLLVLLLCTAGTNACQPQPVSTQRAVPCVAAPAPAPREWTGSALHQAIRNNDAGAVARLLEKKADPNEKDSYGNMPLIAALSPTALLAPLGPDEVEARKTEIQKERAARRRIASLLLEARAEVNAAGARRDTPVIVAIRWGHPATGDLETVRRLLGMGANINAQNDHGDTALVIAARRGSRELVEVLLSHGAAKDLKNCKGQTAISAAKAGNHSGIVSLLGQAGKTPLR